MGSIWTKSLETGLLWQDAGNRYLCEKIGDFTKVSNCWDDERIESFLAFLENYVRVNLGEEEIHMDRFGYPEAARHKLEHASFERRIKEFRKKLSENDRRCVSEFRRCLADWVFDHIAKEDKRLAGFILNSTGIPEMRRAV